MHLELAWFVVQPSFLNCTMLKSEMTEKEKYAAQASERFSKLIGTLATIYELHFPSLADADLLAFLVAFPLVKASEQEGWANIIAPNNAAAAIEAIRKAPPLLFAAIFDD